MTRATFPALPAERHRRSVSLGQLDGDDRRVRTVGRRRIDADDGGRDGRVRRVTNPTRSTTQRSSNHR